MKRFVLEVRNGLYIIDLAKTMQQLREAVKLLEEMVLNHRSILFVGTKKQAKDVVRELAEECDEFYICERWLGGTLTNLVTIRQSIKRLEKIEKKIATASDGLTKKELSLLTKEQIKLNTNLSGIRGMRKVPSLLIVVDPSKEHIAVAEANKLSIPVMGLVDTNCDPDLITHVIACNDDARRSVWLILKFLAQTIKDKKNELRAMGLKEGEESFSDSETGEREEEEEFLVEEEKE